MATVVALLAAMSLDVVSNDDAAAPEIAGSPGPTAEWLVGAKPSPESSTQLDPGRSMLPNEALLTELEEAIGGFGAFGGYFFDGQAIHVYLLDPTVDKHDALIAANRAIDAHPELRTLWVRVVPPKFSTTWFTQWYRLAYTELSKARTITFYHTDENGMQFGVEDESDIAAVEGLLTELGIPLRWAQLEVTGPITDDDLGGHLD